MTSPDQTVLCKYRYDPLDRLASSSPAGQADVQRFYQKNRLATEIEGASRRTVFQHEDLLLAQQRQVDGVVDTTLLATDQQRSVLRLVDKSGIEPVAYSPYGHHPAESGLTSLLGFNGERRDPVTGHYLLGNGYRAYNPVLMRFNNPDSLSPFDEGGLNAYGYCGGDPIGVVDPSGHALLKIPSGIRAIDSVSWTKFKRIAKPVVSTIGKPSSSSANASVTLHNSVRSLSADVSSAKTAASPGGVLPPTSSFASSSLTEPVSGRQSSQFTDMQNARRRLIVEVSADLPGGKRSASIRYNSLKQRTEDAAYLMNYYAENTHTSKRSKITAHDSLVDYAKKYDDALARFSEYDKKYTAQYGTFIRDPDKNE
ncbi:RHS repeat-associated core domain-containing protein [Pseudomonas syringae]|uniref:RHS repeat-associated core domain-containing protein n=3 Tax=Pseudomonas syringae TaxID=317 RepID=UPI0009B3CD73|nr:RHS repeat-associated core domain-containing protein [Pseudomonas syringae]MCH5515412.1 RHS repeat-associated core domain-containing protein [Pseudomonas syringae pv. syringae]MCH5557217.1 RHS repeat-associated core domain-containing protein [Pseudomonas syringae pv. syringae]MCH5628804.1 RHS repeat-associated core domain-containing protein [Pseudomonas syringae pv. syringae]PPS40770.1 hypothetical protein B0F86_14995 [Pseudomonas syringae]